MSTNPTEITTKNLRVKGEKGKKEEKRKKGGGKAKETKRRKACHGAPIHCHHRWTCLAACPQLGSEDFILSLIYQMYMCLVHTAQCTLNSSGGVESTQYMKLTLVGFLLQIVILRGDCQMSHL